MSAAVAASAMAEEVAATQHGEQAEVASASSESPLPPGTPDSKPQSPAPAAPETLTSSAVAAVKGRSRKKQEVAVASPLVEEAASNEEKKKRKRSEHEEAVATPSPSVTAASQILEVAAEGPMARKERMQGKMEQGQFGQVPLPVDVHPQGRGGASDGGVSGSQTVKRSRNGKPRVLSDREILRMKIQLMKQQQLPQGFVPPVPYHNFIDQDSKYSSPFAAFFDQFRYKPDCQQGRNAPSLPKSPDRPARPPPRDHPSSLSSPLTANATFMAAKTVTSKIQFRKQQQLPQGFVPTVANPISIDQDPKYSSPFGAFFDQFRYKPDHQQGRNAPSLPKTPDRPARPPPRDHPSSLSSPLTANATFMAAKITTSKIQFRKQEQLPQGFVPTVANPISIDQDPPFGAFFDQFRYKPDRWQGRNAPSLPKPPEHPARLPPRDHLSSLSSPLTANATFMAAKTTTSNTKQPCSASVSGPQEEVKVKEKKQPEKKMRRMKKPRKPAALLSVAEKWTSKYLRVPLNQLVSPPRSPHKLLQEKYASDPWKVIVICMLLNVTQGKQVRKKVKGFFKRYPDAQTAYTADPKKMALYLKPLGLQRVKTERIQKFSKSYVEMDWKYITDLWGVGKYAADAYAIFCAGKAREVLPKDHKLVDYWKYVCYELPLIEASSQDAQEAAGMTRQGNFVPDMQHISVGC